MSQGRVRRAYWIGIAAMGLLLFTLPPGTTAALWQSVGGRIIELLS